MMAERCDRLAGGRVPADSSHALWFPQHRPERRPAVRKVKRGVGPQSGAVSQVEVAAALARIFEVGGLAGLVQFDAAAWCDVVLGVMAAHADVSCLPADPLAGERAFGELLSWAISGNVPPRYAQVSSDVVS